MELEVFLTTIGLTQKEMGIYLALMNYGPSLATHIAQRTGLHRPAVYQNLPGLIDRGLVTVFPKGKQKFYAAESPEKLKHIISELAGELERMLPELKENFQRRKNKPVVKFLEGKKSITNIMDDLMRTLKRGDAFYRYSSRKSSTGDDTHLPRDYRKIRDQKQLERFVITNEAMASTKKPSMDRAVKIVPAKYGLFDYDITQIIYGDKIAFLDYATQTAFLIESRVIAQFQIKLFKILFDLLPGPLR